MDLSTVGKKLVMGQYSSPQDFVADIRLIFENSYCYNNKGSGVCDVTMRDLGYVM